VYDRRTIKPRPGNIFEDEKDARSPNHRSGNRQVLALTSRQARPLKPQPTALTITTRGFDPPALKSVQEAGCDLGPLDRNS
jgi:hypothetical protein